MPSESPNMDGGKRLPAAERRRQQQQLERLWAVLESTESGQPGGVVQQQLRQHLPEQPLTRRSAGDCLAALQSDWSSASRQTVFRELGSLALENFLAQPLFHPQLAELLYTHAEPLIHADFQEPDWFTRSQHPLADLFGHIAKLASGWDPEQPQADEIRQAICGWLQRWPQQSHSDVLAEVVIWVNRFNQARDEQCQMLASREGSALRLQYVRQLAARSLARQLAGRELPDFMVRQLVDHWLPGLQWILLQQGEDGALWHSANECLGLLIWSVQREAGQLANRPRFERTCAQLRALLPDLIDAFVRDEGARETMIQQIGVAHQYLLEGEAMYYSEVPALEGTSVLDRVNAQISEPLMEQVAQLEQGAWFDRHDGKRMQLLVKDSLHRQLVFVNLAGQRAFSCSWDDFALLLASGEMAAVSDSLLLPDFLVARLNALAMQLRSQSSGGRLRNDSRDKARREFDRLKQGGVTQQSMLNPDTLGVARALAVGSWLEFCEGGSRVYRRLAAVLPETSTFIFVDRTGSNRRELHLDELTSGLAAEAIALKAGDDQRDGVIDGLLEA